MEKIRKELMEMGFEDIGKNYEAMYNAMEMAIPYNKTKEEYFVDFDSTEEKFIKTKRLFFEGMLPFEIVIENVDKVIKTFHIEPSEYVNFQKNVKGAVLTTSAVPVRTHKLKLCTMHHLKQALELTQNEKIMEKLVQEEYPEYKLEKIFAEEIYHKKMIKLGIKALEKEYNKIDQNILLNKWVDEIVLKTIKHYCAV